MSRDGWPLKPVEKTLPPSGLVCAAASERQATDVSCPFRRQAIGANLLAAELEHDAAQVAEVVLIVRLRERIRVASENIVHFA